MSLICTALKDIENVYIRFEIHYADNTIIGTAISDRSITANENQRLSVGLTMDLSNLTPGLYKCTLVSFLCDEYGHQSVLDLVDGALSFSIIESADRTLIWLPQHWGHLRFDDLRIDRINIVEDNL